MTNVPAKLGQRNKDFTGKGDRRLVTDVAQRRGRLRQAAEIITGRKLERFAAFKPTTAGEGFHEALKPVTHDRIPLSFLSSQSFCLVFAANPLFGSRCGPVLTFPKAPTTCLVLVDLTNDPQEGLSRRKKWGIRLRHRLSILSGPRRQTSRWRPWRERYRPIAASPTASTSPVGARIQPGAAALDELQRPPYAMNRFDLP
jgi:hypothetical protein